MKPQDKMTKALVRMLQDARFWGSLACGLGDPIARKDIPTLATDGKHIYFNEKFVDSLTLPETIGSIAHEVDHCSRGHHWRRGKRDHEIFNEACDYEINADLIDAGFILPEGILLDRQFAGMPCEEIYEKIKDRPRSKKPSCGEVLDVTNDEGDKPSQAEIETIKSDWQVRVVQAAHLAKQAGQGSAIVDRIVNDIKKVQQDWREETRRFVLQISKNDTTWSRPNKRFAGAGMYMPSLYSEEIGEIVVAVDLSGSTSDWLEDFFANLKAIKEDVRPKKLTIIYFADGVTKVETFEDDDEFDPKPVGYGGTDVRPVFDYVRDNGIEPACMIVLTDLETPFPDDVPDYPVLWATTEDHPVPFGERVELRR